MSRTPCSPWKHCRRKDRLPNRPIIHINAWNFIMLVTLMVGSPAPPTVTRPSTQLTEVFGSGRGLQLRNFRKMEIKWGVTVFAEE